MTMKMTDKRQAAKQALGRNMSCRKCKFLHICSPTLYERCSAHFLRGYEKGTEYRRKYIEDMLCKYMTAQYGIDFTSRLKDLNEELSKLREKVNITLEMQEGNILYCDNLIDSMADVLAVITHIGSILGITNEQLIKKVAKKVFDRDNIDQYK